MDGLRLSGGDLCGHDRRDPVADQSSPARRILCFPCKAGWVRCGRCRRRPQRHLLFAAVVEQLAEAAPSAVAARAPASASGVVGPERLPVRSSRADYPKWLGIAWIFVFEEGERGFHWFDRDPRCAWSAHSSHIKAEPVEVECRAVEKVQTFLFRIYSGDFRFHECNPGSVTELTQVNGDFVALIEIGDQPSTMPEYRVVLLRLTKVMLCFGRRSGRIAHRLSTRAWLCPPPAKSNTPALLISCTDMSRIGLLLDPANAA